MVEKLNCYCLTIKDKGHSHVVAGSLSEAIKVYLKSTSSVDESVILSVSLQMINVLV